MAKPATTRSNPSGPETQAAKESKPAKAASFIEKALNGGDPMPEGISVVRPPEGDIVDLAVKLAHSQGYRFPNEHNLNASIPVSFKTLAEMIIIGTAITMDNLNGR
jgi:hypothetical protein